MIKTYPKEQESTQRDFQMPNLGQFKEQNKVMIAIDYNVQNKPSIHKFINNYKIEYRDRNKLKLYK